MNQALNLRPSLNMEAAQLVVGAAIIDSRFRKQLFEDRSKALRAVDRLPVAPGHVHLTRQDRRTLGTLRAADLQEFALGIERLRQSVRPTRVARPAANEEMLVG